jgi:hypothetical protein
MYIEPQDGIFPSGALKSSNLSLQLELGRWRLPLLLLLLLLLMVVVVVVLLLLWSRCLARRRLLTLLLLRLLLLGSRRCWPLLAGETLWCWVGFDQGRLF